MIFKANELGKSFKGLISYLEKGKDGLQVGRMEWTEYRNLPTRDPQVAARMMAATSRLSERTEAPVYHFSVSFALEDKVTRETMRRVADGVLRDLGLHQHQVVVTSHRDTLHQHMHFAVNTVHPETHRAWTKWRDWPRGHEAMRRLEKELGLRQVPSPERKREQLQRGATPTAPGRRPLLDRAREEAVAGHFRSAASWGELERGLGEHGIKLQMTGRGMVITDGQETVKASEIDRSFSRFNIEKRLGSHVSYRATRAVAGKSLSEATRSPDSDQNQAQRSVATARPQAARYRAFTAEFERLYDDPVPARRTFLRLAERKGADRAAAELRADPRKFGEVRADARPHLRERMDAAAGAGRAFAAARAERPRLTLKELKTKLAEYDAALVRARAPSPVLLAARARTARTIASEERLRASSRLREMRKSLRWTYADPVDARRRILEAARAGESHDSIVRDIRNGSERFGAHRSEQRGRLLGIIARKPDRSAALASAPETAQRVEAALQAASKAPSRAEMIRLRERSFVAESALDRSRSERSATDLERQIGGLMQRLGGATQQHVGRALGPMAQGPVKLVNTVNQIRQLAVMVKAPYLALAQAALQIAQQLARGMEQDRGGRD